MRLFRLSGQLIRKKMPFFFMYSNQIVTLKFVRGATSNAVREVNVYRTDPMSRAIEELKKALQINEDIELKFMNKPIPHDENVGAVYDKMCSVNGVITYTLCKAAKRSTAIISQSGPSNTQSAYSTDHTRNITSYEGKSLPTQHNPPPPVSKTSYTLDQGTYNNEALARSLLNGDRQRFDEALERIKRVDHVKYKGMMMLYDNLTTRFGV